MLPFRVMTLAPILISVEVDMSAACMASLLRLMTSPRLSPKSFIRSSFTETLLVFTAADYYTEVVYCMVLGEMDTEPFLSNEDYYCKVGKMFPPAPKGLICMCLAKDDMLGVPVAMVVPYWCYDNFLTSSSMIDKFKHDKCYIPAL